MPKQNRVNPFGDIVATPARGTLMGNRGILHNNDGEIVRQWTNKRWIACLLDFKDRKSQVMAPGYYTQLFFLDEATALAAGHRPCAACRHSKYKEFLAKWVVANANLLNLGKPNASVLDSHLHQERTQQSDRYELIDDLPDGVFVKHQNDLCLVWKGHLWSWRPDGYQMRVPWPQGTTVSLVTPASIMRTFRAGYAPDVHEPA